MNRDIAFQAIAATTIILVGPPLVLLALLLLLGRIDGDGVLLLVLFPLATTVIGLALLPVSNGIRIWMALTLVPLTFYGIIVFAVMVGCSAYGDCL